MGDETSKVTNPLWAYEELQGSDFSMVRACSQCLWDEVQSNRKRITELEDTLRQIATPGDGSNARLAAQALEDGHE